jgi:hypothetical protein
VRFREFERRAHQVFAEIPEHFRDGVDGLDVRPDTVPHPTLPEIVTLGECLTEHYPSDFGGPGTIRSLVVLYHGSFQSLARRSEEWDWEHEIWETITHEIQHHLESLASDDRLEVRDFVEDQNFARRQGEPFDPYFYRDGERFEPGAYEVDGDLFVELEVDGSALRPGERLRVEVEGEPIAFRAPDPLGEPHYLTLEGVDGAVEGGELIVVLLPRRGFLTSLARLLTGRRGAFAHSVAPPEEVA